jgi:hypothetical protein
VTKAGESSTNVFVEFIADPEAVFPNSSVPGGASFIVSGLEGLTEPVLLTVQPTRDVKFPPAPRVEIRAVRGEQQPRVFFRSDAPVLPEELDSAADRQGCC